MQGELVQILATCPTCRVEAAVVELVEIGPRDSVVVEGRCRMCGRAEDHGQVTTPGRRVWTRQAVVDAVTAWASSDGEEDVVAFVASGFGGLELAGITAALQAGHPVETSFDVVAWLFPGMGGGGGGMAPAEAEPEELARAAERGPRGGGGVLARAAGAESTEVAREPVRTADEAVAPPSAEELARLPLRALAAVMLADGVIRPGERRFLDAFAGRMGLPAVTEADLRPWRPGDLPWPDAPQPVLRAMVDLAFIDKERDGSEWRVVREFARHWAQDLEALEALGREKEDAVAPAMTRLWRSLRGLFLVEGD